MGQVDSGAGVTPPVVAGSLGAPPVTWPTALGVVSIVMGALGVARHGCGALQAVMMKVAFGGMVAEQPASGASASDQAMFAAMEKWQVASGVVSVAALLLAVWLLVAGIVLLRRRRSATWLHKSWAWTRIAVALAEAGVAYASQTAMMGQAVAGAQSAGGAASTAPLTGFVTAYSAAWALGLLLVGVAYPITVLVLLAMPWVKREVARWPGKGAA